MSVMFARPDRKVTILILYITILLTCMPILLFAAPPVQDYPNHLVRIWLLSVGADFDIIRTMYNIDWSNASTNIAVDWLASQLSSVLPLWIIDRSLLLLMFLGPPVGAIYLSHNLFGRWDPWQLAALSLTWTTTAIAGFLSYSISLAAALFAAAVLVKARHWRIVWLAPLHLAICTVLLLIHRMGMCFYLALAVGIAIGEKSAWQVPVVQPNMIARITLLCVASCIPIAVLKLLSSHPPSTDLAVFLPIKQMFAARTILETLWSPFASYQFRGDVAAMAPIFGICITALAKGKFQIHRGLLIVSLALAALAIIAPMKIGDASWLDRRVPLMVALTLFSSILPKWPEPRLRDAITIIFILSILGKAAWIGSIWQKRSSDVVELKHIGQYIRPGEAVIVVRQYTPDPNQAPIGRFLVGSSGSARETRRHLPSMLVIWRHAFIPTIFAVPGQHPLRIAPLRRSYASPLSRIPFPDELKASTTHDVQVSRWKCDFTKLLLIGADQPTRTALDTSNLYLLAQDGFAALYAIKPAEAGAPCGPRLVPE